MYSAWLRWTIGVSASSAHPHRRDCHGAEPVIVWLISEVEAGPIIPPGPIIRPHHRGHAFVDEAGDFDRVRAYDLGEVRSPEVSTATTPLGVNVSWR